MIDSIFKDSPLDAVKARVQIYNTEGRLVSTCTCDPETSSQGVLSDFSVSREGAAGKFFGFGICHKLNMTVIDLNKELSFTKGYSAKIAYGNGTRWDRCYPTFYFDEVTVDKKTGDIIVIAYDKLKSLPDYTWDDLGIEQPTASYGFSLGRVPYQVESLLGLAHNTVPTAMQDINYDEKNVPNYDGSEDCRSVLDDVAEVICSIYYLDHNDLITWKKVCIDTNAVLQIESSDYYEWEEGARKTLSRIYSTNELEDTIGVEIDANGNAVQYIRENPLLTLRSDIKAILQANSAAFSMTPFVLDWAGDYTLEIGDCIEIHTREGDSTTKVFILSDIVEYAGTLSQATSWEWTDNDAENDKTPVNIGEKINQTFAKVDKVNKEITLLTEEVGGYPQKMAQMQVTVDDVTTKVSRVEQVHTEELDTVNDRLDTLTKETALKVDAEGVEIIVERTLSSGVDKVVTAAKKYTFDDTGLNVSSSGSNISTTITEDGMRIYRAGQEVLTADNEGVKAEDLHATTYLIIGKTSRLEDRENRTACFWIGD